jgi:hypothetical protein
VSGKNKIIGNNASKWGVNLDGQRITTFFHNRAITNERAGAT